MLWTIAVVLVILWLLGLVSSYTLGGVIHILLHCHCCCAGQSHSGEKSVVARRSLAGEGEVFGEESGKHLRKDFAESFDTLQ